MVGIQTPGPSPLMVAFMGGATGFGCLVAGVFFLRFWIRTRDRLFLAFALAFWLLALNQGLPVLLGVEDTHVAGLYMLRLAAFVLIVAAVLNKNLQGRSR